MRPLQILINPNERVGFGPPSPAADLSNVIPFARGAATEPNAPPITITPVDRPAPPTPDTGRYRLLALVVGSLMIHGGLFYMLWQGPRPLASIDIDAIEVEIVVGDNRAAGAATTPGENEVQPTPPVEEVKEEDKPVEQEQQKVVEEAREELPLEQPPVEKQPTPPSEPADAAGGSGRQAVVGDTKYYGLVATHLARHKQYPPAARNNRIQGNGAVTFAIDANGGVTSVSVARTTGNAILDQELAAMVRRAAPFPKPPNGQSMSFTVPVRFGLN